MQNKDRYISDVLYGNIKLSKIANIIIDTPIFQRLRDIKQLSVAHYVFPSANHTRFEHSIGVYYLAKYLLKKIGMKITEKEKELISIAGLIHDIGHCAYSHLFDEFLKNKNIPENMKTHEQRAEKAFKDIINSNLILKEYFTSKDIEFVLSIIYPKSNQNDFRYQIISNNLNGIDVDKLDYINRDAYYLGIKCGTNWKLILSQVKIIDDNICFPEKIKYELYSLFETRYRLHKQIYSHKSVISVHLMIIDILEENKEEILKENMYKLTDSYFHFKFQDHPIYQRILNRKLYKINDNKEGVNDDNKNDNKNVSVTYNSKIGFISGNKPNPLDNIYFYSTRKDENEKYKITKDRISSLICEVYQENIKLSFIK